MSFFSYVESRKLQGTHEFDTLIMTALREADSENAYRLRVAFPDLCDELQQRYDAPGGLLEGETNECT